MHPQKFWPYIFVALIATVSPAAGQMIQNLGFEAAAPAAPGLPDGWSVRTAGYRVVRDTIFAHGGSSSLRIENTGITDRFATASQSLRTPSPRPRRVRLRGWIRTGAITRGHAGLWVRVDGPGDPPRMLAFDNMEARGATGTTPWKRYEIDLPLDSTATSVSFGVLHTGSGVASFDDLELAFDGRPHESMQVGVRRHASREIAWLRANAYALATDAPGSGLDDLERLAPLVDGARLVGLGEGTHGTREFFRAKHRIVEWLAERKGLTVFAIEASMPEARRVNEYVLTGRGDARIAVAGLGFWTWNTEEVVALVEWMRAYNASGRGRVEFWGFDMQNTSLAADSVRAFLARADPVSVPLVDDAIALAKEGQRATEAVAAARRVVAHMAANRSAYLARFDTVQVDWAEQYARIVEQGVARRADRSASRDSSMAENVRWIVEHQPAGARIALWAHNGHVARVHGRMGAYLDRMYGTQYRVFGFALGEGEYTVRGPRGLGTYASDPPPPGSVEEALRAVQLPRFVLDVRRASADPRGAWLAEPLPLRSIGSSITPISFFATPVARHFDALVYFDHTTASRRLSFKPTGSSPVRP